MKSSSLSSSSSSNDSWYFSAIPSPRTRENSIHGEDDTAMEPSPPPAASSSSSSCSQSLSMDPSSSTRENTHHDRFISFREKDMRMISSASSCSSLSCQPSSSNPGPSTSGENTHDVFISFRGEDTRRGFVSYLHDALRRNGIRTYKDDWDLERGNEISSTLLRAIERSKISIIVFSKNYASSRWTLDELVKIIECQRTRAQVVLPIFYEISPSEVRKKRSHSTVFMFKSGMNETEQRWASALKKAAGLAGWESSNYRTESELVEVIANEVKSKLESMSYASEGLSSPNCSPDEPNSGGSSHDEYSSPRKCLSSSYGNLNLLGYLLWRKEHERLILKTRRPHQPSRLDASSSYVYRNRFVPKQEQRWWETQQEHVQQ